MPGMPGMGGESETNLLSILLNAAFGFVAGLMFLFGIKEVLAYGTALATDLMEIVGYGQMGAMGGFSIASAAPYIVLAPLAGMVAKQLSSVRSIKSFAFFAAAVAAGFAAAYFSQGYFATMI